MSTCSCADPLWKLETDGRKPLRCAYCGRRMAPARRLRKAAQRARLWLAAHGL